MEPNVLTYPMRYLTLRSQSGRSLFMRDFVPVLLLTIFISLPFVFLDANYYAEKGFLDRFGSFSAVLTGFYIAGLVGIASFSSSIGDLDGIIEVGKIIRYERTSDNPRGQVELTRRQYVCTLFGYMSFLSMLLSVISIMLIVLAEKSDVIKKSLEILISREKVELLGSIINNIVLFAFNFALVHLLVTTCHGFYYLIDRLYARKPAINPKVTDMNA